MFKTLLLLAAFASTSVASTTAVPDGKALSAQINAVWTEVRAAAGAADGVGARTLHAKDETWAKTVKWKDQLLEVARTPIDWSTVEWADRDMRGVMDMIFQSWSADPAAQTALLAEMKASPMPALQEYAAAKERFSKLHQQPWDLSFTATDGRKVDLASLRGKPVIVAYWSASCRGSRKQASKLTTLYQRHHAAGLEIVGLNFDSEEERAETERYAAEQGFVWPHRIDRQLRRDEFDRYGFTWVSNILLLDAEGRVLRSAPSLDLEEWDQLIQQQLASAKKS